MPTQCIRPKLEFGRSGGRKLVGAFDGGAITSNGGVVLLAAAESRLRLADRLADCFKDLRVAAAIKHTLPDLLRQRIFGLALGYEDLIDHDALRFDPALAAAINNSVLIQTTLRINTYRKTKYSPPPPSYKHHAVQRVFGNGNHKQ